MILYKYNPPQEKKKWHRKGFCRTNYKSQSGKLFGFLLLFSVFFFCLHSFHRTSWSVTSCTSLSLDLLEIVSLFLNLENQLAHYWSNTSNLSYWIVLLQISAQNLTMKRLRGDEIKVLGYLSFAGYIPKIVI